MGTRRAPWVLAACLLIGLTSLARADKNEKLQTLSTWWRTESQGCDRTDIHVYCVQQ